MNGNRNMNGNTYKLKLPRLISDGMVLQRNAAARIWGWAAPLEKVTLVFVGKVYVTFAGMDGSWEVIMDEMEAGGPYQMEIMVRRANHPEDTAGGHPGWELDRRRFQY